MALLLTAVVSGCATHAPPAVPDRRSTLNGHSLTLHFANPGAAASRPLLVFATGDGGMHRKDLDLYRHLEAWGYPLVGFDAHDYVKHLGASETTTPERLAEDYREVIAAAREALHLDRARRVVLVGVSRGAGLSVVAAGELHTAVAGIVAIALTREEEYVHWYHRLRVPERPDVMVDVEEYLPQLGDLPLAVVQSTHDKYLPGAVARTLLGADGPHRWLQIVDAHNHSFDGARDQMYEATKRAIEWIEPRIATRAPPTRESRIADPRTANRDDNHPMNCPNCGAPMELSPAHGFYRCRYCNTFYFPDAVDDQGVRVLGPAQDTFLCPICQDPLLLAMLDGYQVHYCQRCRGLLIPRACFAEIVRRRRSWAQGAPVTPIPPDKRAMRRTIVCPTCRRPMIVDHYYGPGNIVMDGCPACDTVWLDFGELKQIVDAPGADRGSRDAS